MTVGSVSCANIIMYNTLIIIIHIKTSNDQCSSLSLMAIINPRLRMRSEGYSSRSVCLCVCECVCVCVYDYSRTTGYEAAYERYQQLQCYKGRKNNVAILLKRLRSRDMA